MIFTSPFSLYNGIISLFFRLLGIFFQFNISFATLVNLMMDFFLCTCSKSNCDSAWSCCFSSIHKFDCFQWHPLQKLSIMALQHFPSLILYSKNFLPFNYLYSLHTLTFFSGVTINLWSLPPIRHLYDILFVFLALSRHFKNTFQSFKLI